MSAASRYEMVVGLEVHVQLKTRTKAFCRCSQDRIEGVLRSFAAEEREGMVEPDGRIHVTCEYCSRNLGFPNSSVSASSCIQNVDLILTGSASRTENGTFLIPALFRSVSTVNVVVRTISTPWLAKRRIWFMSAGLNPGNPGTPITLPMNGLSI